MADEAILRLRKQWDVRGWDIKFLHLPGATQPDITVDIPFDTFKTSLRSEIELLISQQMGAGNWKVITQAQFDDKLKGVLDKAFNDTLDGIVAAAKREVKPT